MSIPISYNGQTYQIPVYNDVGWAQNAGNLTLYLVALGQSLTGYASDITLTTAGTGIILTDRFNGHTYRIFMNNGVLDQELVS